MEDINIEATKSTPRVRFSSADHLLRLEGQSYPENAFVFWQPLLTWAKGYFGGNPEATRVEIQLNYLNTSSSKCLMDLIDMVEQAVSEGTRAKIHWFCEEGNERAFELAEEFMEGMDIPYEVMGVTD